MIEILYMIALLWIAYPILTWMDMKIYRSRKLKHLVEEKIVLKSEQDVIKFYLIKNFQEIMLFMIGVVVGALLMMV